MHKLNVFRFFASLRMTLLIDFYFLVDDFESAVRNQCLRDADAFRCLMVFKQGSQDTWQCQCRTIQCVAKFCLLFSSTVTALQAVCLVCVEVRYRTYFQPTLLCFRVNFEVEAKSSSEAHVTTTKTEDAVRKFELLQQTFYVFQHFLV